ncbi:MAG: flagellar biosynthesis protein FlhB [Desulfuromonadales bacterium C00003068]|jgi:flagellar biosynthetic protein FlhB|nr:flagellar biosynthesis protein FlhB [Deltaproteobacteria bacterium]OEU73687.1 MAG: flagellar biosynthesis protein FlhB [Desulfuromonadales bacterium C00003068]
MAEESGSERTEEASSKRRDDFRKKGQVAQSKEINTAALMAVSILLWYFYGPRFWSNLSWQVEHIWSQAGQYEVTPQSMVQILRFVLKNGILLLAPIFLMVLVIGFCASFFQIGWLFTTQPLMPDFSKLDPIKGAARFVSKKSFVELIKSLAKVILVGYVAYKTLFNEFENALYLVQMDTLETLNYVGRVALVVLFKSCGIMLLLALIDFIFVRYEMEEKMKMTKQEQKEEHKESEGDPQLKARIRQMQQEMARNRMMSEVPKADVVITNPTHLSIAIHYEQGKTDAPIVVAKGADHLAMKIREIARENNVPLVENVPVARALYKVDIGAVVPEQMFKAVAEILAYVYSLKRRR